MTGASTAVRACWRPSPMSRGFPRRRASVSPPALAVARSKELQKRFSERFGHLRCRELLAEKYDPETVAPEAAALGITGHCALMIAAAVEITEELLAK